MTQSERSPQEWFAEAVRFYVEHHQGCPWCGGCHRVFHTETEVQREYYCTGCDFHVGYDHTANSYFTFPGEHQVNGKPATMIED
jgi:hypothetical protein